MIEIKEVIRQWLAGIPKKRIAAQLGLDPKTVRRYIAQAQSCGLELDHGVAALTDARVSEIVAALRTRPARAPSDSWLVCEQQRAVIGKKLGQGLRLTRVHRLLARQGARCRTRRCTATPLRCSASAAQRRRWPSRTANPASNSRSTPVG